MHMAYPMFIYVFYITLLGFYNFQTRKRHVQSKQVRLSYMKTYQGEAPEEMVTVARHFDNQFQVPMLFLITCLATHIFIGSNPISYAMAWAFIVTRVLHSYIHLTSNNVLRRAAAFFAGFAIVLAMWIYLIVKVA